MLRWEDLRNRFHVWLMERASRKIVSNHKSSGHKEHLSSRSVARYNSGNRRFIQHAVGNGARRLKDIKPEHVISYVSLLERKGRSCAYIQAELSGIRKLLPDAGPKVPRPRMSGEEKAETARWSSEQFFTAIDDVMHIDPTDIQWAAMNLGWFEGLRLQEAVSVATADPRDLQRMLRGGFISVLGKGGKYREIPIFGAARLTINHLVQMHHAYRQVDLVATARDLERTINDRREGWGADGKTFHGLRYSFARHQFEEGLKLGLGTYGSAVRVSNMLGHDDIRVTMTYIGEITL